MTLLVTGGTGFVMSVLARHWAQSDSTARVVVLDSAAPDAAASRYFAPVADRLKVVVGDIRDAKSWQKELDECGITHVVHGATVTPISRGSVAEAKREPEAELPGHIVDVNVMGTVAILDWVRTCSAVRRFIYVSSGSVYKNHGPDRPGEPLPEDGYVMPRRLYGVSKLASELITERYGELFGLSTTSVRLSSVYGTMDRATASRNYRHVPNRIAHMALEGAKRVRVNTLEAVGDYIHAEDVARALESLLKAKTLRYSTYNIAAGVATTIGELVEWTAQRVPGFTAEVVTPEKADIIQDASLKDGMWGAYDISRIGVETGWKPRPLKQAFHGYMDWIANEEAQLQGGGASG